MKKIIFTIFILGIIIFGVYYFGFLNKKENKNLFIVQRGEVSKEISETGQIKIGDKFSLSFKRIGKIEKIYVKENEKVKKGQLLAKLETRELEIEKESLKAQKLVWQSKLEKLLAGPTKEEIERAKANVEKAEVALKNAEVFLENTKLKAKEDLSNVFADALTLLNTAYLTSYDTKNFVENYQKNYFTLYDQESIKVRDALATIKKKIENIKVQKEKAEKDKEKIEQILFQVKEDLKIICDCLYTIREISESPVIVKKIPQSEKDLLDSKKSAINEVLNQTIKMQKTISSVKLANKINIEKAEGNVDLAKENLKLAKKELNLLLAKPRKEDIKLIKAQIENIDSQLEKLEFEIQESFLKSPVSGQIEKIYKKEGELISSPRDKVLTLISSSLVQVCVDIYEEDVPQIKIGSLVKINLPAFPQKTFKGKVIFIDDTPKIIDDVTYYEIKIAFLGEIPNEIKEGMTADITIETAKKENVLIVPNEAIFKEKGEAFVEVFENGKIEKRKIKTGLEGENFTEIISGLKEGEKVILE